MLRTRDVLVGEESRELVPRAVLEVQQRESRLAIGGPVAEMERAIRKRLCRKHAIGFK